MRARVFSSKSWSMAKMILARSSAFLSPEFLKSLCRDSWSMFSKMLPTAFLRAAVSKW
ncbi:rCG43175 [Rattus norvegicus]|uniref:RCG43175 n=1 Tax=Rattus norvegicus TaxID=10116 RepID=A6IW36_RAT|nr:rCG43175 [Rattus norvegicus]